MIKKIALLIGITVSFHATAEIIVDLYGDNSKAASRIVKNYSQQIAEIESVLQNYYKAPDLSEKQLQNVLLKRVQLAERIKKEGDFLYVNFETIFYPDKKNEYTTIEVVSKNNPERMQFISSTDPTEQSPVKKDLINQMIEFTNLEAQLMITNKLDMNDVSCPVYHCVSGFHNAQLKPYLEIFNQGAIKERTLIINTLNNDKDPERRAAAAFLIGHFQDPKEIIALLLPHVNDNNSTVKNNVIRVIGMTMITGNISKIDVIPFLKLLDSPEDTDRNKSLLVLLNAASSPATNDVIIQQGGVQLISLLKLKQPNNHELAYQILKKISGKHFKETDIASWQKWINATSTKASARI